MSNEPLVAAPADGAWQQLQHRLLNLSLQFDDLHTQLAQLANTTRASADQVDVLTRHLTATQPLHAVHEQMATLQAQVAANQEQLATLSQQLHAGARQEQVDALAAALRRTATYEQLERLLDLMPPREQIEQLLQTVANQAQVEQLDENFKRLSRTQFKANSLTESKEQQVERALATLQELATRRARLEESQNEQVAQQVERARRTARGEFAAELLPALDSLELALDHGAALLTRQQTQADEIGAQQQHYLEELQAFLKTQVSQQQTPAAPGLWRRLFGAAPEPPPEPAPAAAPPALPPTPAAATALQESLYEARAAIQAWLQGLALVQQRFVALLATEEIQEIDALHRRFDPRLHVAVDTVVRDDVAPNQIVAIARKGYRQRERILRYAEVVVVRQLVAAPIAEPATTQDEESK
jgi:molecular chaperone GrpE (heat shock protein)